MRTSLHRSVPAGTLAITALLAAAPLAHAGVEFQTGNIQWTNVNINADQSANTIVGEVDHLGVAVYFDGFGAAPTSSVVTLHGQHGVAFVEALNPGDQLFRLTVTAQSGYAFANIDWKLDAMPPSDGLVTFTAFDALGNVIPLSTGTNQFFFGHNGQNPFHAHADAGTPISVLQIDSTVPILDIKQVSVDLVPAPSGGAALAMLGIGALRRRRR